MKEKLGFTMFVVLMLSLLAFFASFGYTETPYTTYETRYLAACYVGSPCPVPHKLVTAIYRRPDWSAEEIEERDDYFAFRWGGHFDTPYISSSSRIYNCHAYAFGRTGYWINDPSNYLCSYTEDDHFGGYEVDESGYIHRFAAHSAHAGNLAWSYRAKCGAGPLVYHDAFIYGWHNTRWEPRND